MTQIRYPDLRRDRRCLGHDRRGDPRAAPRTMSQRGADVIDLGCLPDTPFPHLEEAIGPEGERLQGQRRFRRSDELLRGGKAGADYLLSLNEDDAAHRRPSRLDAGADPQGPWRHGLALSRHGRARRRKAVPISPTPCSIPSISASCASLERYAELRRDRPERRDADGHRQSHRAHRRRHDRASPPCCSASPRSCTSGTCSSCR